MQETKPNSRNYWPAPQDYNEAVQNLRANLSDPELASGEVELSMLGLPKPISGGFASVYRVNTSSSSFALRCFLRNTPDVQWRYERICAFLQETAMPYTAAVDYQSGGIKIAGKWYPILKMDWLSGDTLDSYVRKTIETTGHIGEWIGDSFISMCVELRAAGVAHGDLQHGNIIVENQKLKLVDYDGMFVPELAGAGSNELGHRNYQHPGRTGNTYGPFLDNFSAWIIYVSLKCMSIDPSLYARLKAGDDCLLFRHQDLVAPLSSLAFAALEEHSNEEIALLTRYIRWLLSLPPEDCPALEESVSIPESVLPPRLKSAPTVEQAKAKYSLRPSVFGPPSSEGTSSKPHVAQAQTKDPAFWWQQPDIVASSAKKSPRRHRTAIAKCAPQPNGLQTYSTTPVPPQLVNQVLRQPGIRRKHLAPLGVTLCLAAIPLLQSVLLVTRTSTLVGFLSVVVPILLAALYWKYFSCPEIPDHQFLVEHGDHTGGMVTGKFKQGSRCYLTYKYITTAGVMAGTMPVSPACYRSAKPGHRLIVFFEGPTGSSFAYEYSGLEVIL